MAAGDSVQQIKDRLNILDVVGPYVELHKAGKHYKGRCPFHTEKTPSFHVSPDRGLYHCYGCSVGGDMFTFIEEIEGVDFKGALKILADKAGVELVAEDPKKRSERERIVALLEAATEYFVTELATCKDVADYLERRGVTEKTILTWRIGYAPGPPERGWRELRTHLKSLGYTDEEMLKAGVIKRTDSGKEPFDVFRDRVMFPMANQSGTIVAYSGRILSKDSDAPKYVNSPETELYKKSELLFGYDKAKSGIRHLDFSLIVEGQFDVVMCHQAGYQNAVAVSGTAFTAQHLALLERLSSRVVLALDADKAGINAMKRAAELMLRRALDVKVAVMPDGADPADIIQNDPKQFKHIIGQSVHVIEFLLTVLKKQSKDERSFKLQGREEIIPLLAVMPNHIDQEHFAGVVATTLGVSTDAIMYELDLVRERMKEVTPATPEQTSKPSVQTEQAQNGVSWQEQADALAAYILIAQEVVSGDIGIEFKNAVASDKNLEETLKRVDAELEASRRSELIFKLEDFVEGKTVQMLRDELWHRLRRWHDLSVKAELKSAREALQEAEQMQDSARTEEVLTAIQVLQERLKNNSFEEQQD